MEELKFNSYLELWLYLQDNWIEIWRKYTTKHIIFTWKSDTKLEYNNSETDISWLLDDYNNNIDINAMLKYPIERFKWLSFYINKNYYRVFEFKDNKLYNTYWHIINWDIKETRYIN